MRAPVLLTFTAVAVLAAILVVAWPEEAPVAAPVPPAEHGPEPLAVGGAAPHAGAVRRGVAAGFPVDAPVLHRAVDRDHDLHGRVLGPGGEAVRGARVRVLRWQRVEYFEPGRRPEATPDEAAAATTDGHGEFAFRLPTGRAFEVEATAAGFAPTRVPACFAGEYVELALREVAGLHGRVLATGGAPVAGALVTGLWKDRALRGDPYAFGVATDDHGAFDVRGLEPAPIELFVTHPRHQASRWHAVPLDPGRMREVADIVLAPGAIVQGRVVDGRTGHAIAGAVVSDRSSFPRSVRTDASGAFAFGGLGRFERELVVRARGYGAREVVVRGPQLAPRPDGLVVELLPGRRARGVVLDGDGRPVADAVVAALAGAGGTPRREDWCTTRSQHDGAFEIDDLRADLRHFLFVRKEGFGAVLYDFPLREHDGPIVELGAVHLARGGVLHGVVVDGAGVPLRNHGVTLLGANRDQGLLAGLDRIAGASVSGYAARRVAQTDDIGRFCFRDVAAGDYELQAATAAAAESPPVGFTIRAEQTLRGLRVVVAGVRRITGRVTTDDGSPLPSVTVVAEPEGPGGRATARAAAGGGFLLRGLHPGRYTVTVTPVGAPDAPAPRFAAVQRTGVAAGALEVAFVLPRAATVEGIVVDAGGQPVPRALLLVHGDRGGLRVAGKTGTDGRFAVAVARGSHVVIKAVAPRAGAPSLQGEIASVAAGSRGIVVRIRG